MTHGSYPDVAPFVQRARRRWSALRARNRYVAYGAAALFTLHALWHVALVVGAAYLAWMGAR